MIGTYGPLEILAVRAGGYEPAVALEHSAEPNDLIPLPPTDPYRIDKNRPCRPPYFLPSIRQRPIGSDKPRSSYTVFTTPVA